MKKTNLIIAITAVIVLAAVFYFISRPKKECTELNEQECKFDDRCLSVLIPCTDPACTSDAVFKECKAKE